MPLFPPRPTDPAVVELCALLETAEAVVRAQSGERLMDGFKSNADFADFIRDTRRGMAQGTSSWWARRKLSFAFAPTSDWDDCTLDAPLGNRCYLALHAAYGWWR